MLAPQKTRIASATRIFRRRNCGLPPKRHQQLWPIKQFLIEYNWGEDADFLAFFCDDDVLKIFQVETALYVFYENQQE